MYYVPRPRPKVDPLRRWVWLGITGWMVGCLIGLALGIRAAVA